MAGLMEEERANARKKNATLLREEHSIKIIVGANETLLSGQGDAAIIKTSPKRKPEIRKEDNMRSSVNLYEYVKVSETRCLVIITIVSVKLGDIHGGSIHHGITMILLPFLDKCLLIRNQTKSASVEM
jgi:hypothetical protein